MESFNPPIRQQADFTASYRSAWHSACLLVAAVVGLLLAGCSTTTLTSGAALGAAGKTTATTMHQAAILSPDLVQRFELSDSILMGYYNGVAADQIKLRHKLVEAVQGELALRASVLDNLADAYTALDNLASYDASGSFNTAAGGLVTATNAYLKGANMAQLPSDASSLLPAAGGFLVGLFQGHQVRDASDKILVPLKQVIAAMEQYEREFVGFKQIIVSQSGDAAQVIYNTGLYSVAPLLNSIGAPYGLTALPNADAKLAEAKNKSMRAGLNAGQTTLVQAQTASVSTAFDQSLSAMKKLQSQHEALDNGAPLDLSQLLEIVGELQATVATMTSALGTTPKGGGK
jgi:hypothetical protein